MHVRCIAALCGIVFLATAPWDNWAVHRGFWTFDWQRTTPVTVVLGGVAWRLPAEEYAFFLIETVEVALLTLLFLPRPTRPMKWHYFVHLVGWAGPLLALQWVIGWRVFRRNLRAVFVPAVAMAIFLGVAIPWRSGRACGLSTPTKSSAGGSAGCP